MSPLLYCVVTVQVTEMPATVAALIVPLSTEVTVITISLAGLNPPSAVPAMLNVFPSANPDPPFAIAREYAVPCLVMLNVALDPEPVTVVAATAENT